jgi:ABC-2 type transport system permease protein
MSSVTFAPAGPRDRPSRLRYSLRVLRVVAGVEFKLKYTDSVLGVVWSVLKPLAYFTVLWMVFGRLFNQASSFPHYPLFLLIGIVVYTFFVDATSTAIPSVVTAGSMIRRLSFPRQILPISTTLTSAITFAINLGVVVVFIAVSRVAPQWSWLLIPLLLVELYAFILGLAFLLSAAYVRFRDVGQVWELVVQLLFYASPIMYPVGFLPPWFQTIAFLNPLVQVIQDFRAVVVGSNQPHGTITAVYGSSFARLLPVAIAFLILAVGFAFFRRRAPHFAEEV